MNRYPTRNHVNYLAASVRNIGAEQRVSLARSAIVLACAAALIMAAPPIPFL